MAFVAAALAPLLAMYVFDVFLDLGEAFPKAAEAPRKASSWAAEGADGLRRVSAGLSAGIGPR